MHDDYKQLDLSQLASAPPNPVTLERCPICASEAQLWQYSESETTPRQLVVMCSHAERTAPQGPCTVCGKPFAEHGSYPTCASHPYTADATCQHVPGATCVGSECINGCVRGRGNAGVQAVSPEQSQTRNSTVGNDRANQENEQ